MQLKGRITMFLRNKRPLKSIIRYYNSKKLPNLHKSQWWPLEKLISFQNKRLRIILDYVYNNIPAYRRKFQEVGLFPEDIKSRDDLYKLPITTRQEMQNNPDFVNESLVLATLYTGGSTGTSLKYHESFLATKMRVNAHLRGWSWNGYKPGKKLAVISSAQGVVGGENVLNLSGDLIGDSLKLNVEKLLKFKPEHLRGYASSLYILAKHCLDNNIKIEGIESINPISENLYDYQRETMKRAFSCEVFDEYVCNDGGACGWECEKFEGHHYFMERAIIEENDGEMIVTDLWNRAMPFIRYRNGDSVTFLDERCSCDRELPLMKVRGRTNDFIITPHGPVSPTFAMHICIGIPRLRSPEFRGDASFRSDNGIFRHGIGMVQYVQKPGYRLVVNAVKNDQFTQKMFESFRKEVETVFAGMDIAINFVDAIPTTKKGKRQFIINEDKELLRQLREGSL